MPSKPGHSGNAAQPVGRCPICREPAVPEHRPFCSRRCGDVDLGRWLSGTYAIGGTQEEDAVGEDEGLRQASNRQAPQDGPDDL